MPTFTLRYGQSTRSFTIPDGVHVDVISPLNVPGAPDPAALVANGLDNPVGGVTLSSFAGARSAAIAINDKTRPVPHATLLPPLLERLEGLGIPPASITLVIATGTHIPMPAEEFPRVLPESIIARYPVISHDCDAPDLVPLGSTTRGTPVLANPVFMAADLRIVIGNVEPHHFMGFSGGVKSAAVGLSGRQTINLNHALLGDPLATTGHYQDNPMRQEVEEIGRMMGVHFALNAVMNIDKQIVRVIAGQPVAVMEAAIPVARNICQVSIDAPYDLVIASAGGHPKDINFYQSQKALTHAALTARDGGTVILVTACPEGVGSPGYERFMEGVTSLDGVFEKFAKTGFVVGPHKALQVALIARRVDVRLHSEIEDAQVRSLLLTPANDLQASIDAALSSLPAGARVAVLPIAVITIPVLPA